MSAKVGKTLRRNIAAGMNYRAVEGITVTTRDGASYIGSVRGQLIRTDHDHRSKKERNRDKVLRRRANEIQDQSTS
jgi:hypothetical protein